MRKRLDLLLVERGLAETREKAKAMILAGHVLICGEVASKAGHLLDPLIDIRIKETPKYVSRGGQKLEAALKAFGIDPQGKTVIDVGASTGGFTDCLLQWGAERVIAVDVGYGQLHQRLRSDPRVISLEKTNIRYLKREDLPFPVHGATVDVSFISLRLIAAPISGLLTPEAFLIALIKPQFEAGRQDVGKGGVVRDPSVHQRVKESVSKAFLALGWRQIGLMESPIRGPKGNTEFLLGLKRP